MKVGILSLAVAVVAVIGTLAIKAILERHGMAEQGYQHRADSISLGISRVQQPRTATSTPKPMSATSNSAVENGPTNSSAGPVQEPLQDPFARIALTYVGVDPDAEDYWFAAINDLSLPAAERQNLIEDLNEEGLSDPEHPTLDDLPLIFNRLALIETIGPDAADEANAEAFMEAYKDLLNLAEVAMGGGEPVR